MPTVTQIRRRPHVRHSNRHASACAQITAAALDPRSVDAAAQIFTQRGHSPAQVREFTPRDPALFGALADAMALVSR